MIPPHPLYGPINSFDPSHTSSESLPHLTETANDAEVHFQATHLTETENDAEVLFQATHLTKTENDAEVLF